MVDDRLIVDVSGCGPEFFGAIRCKSRKGRQAEGRDALPRWMEDGEWLLCYRTVYVQAQETETDQMSRFIHVF